jgi:hypothetical protein
MMPGKPTGTDTTRSYNELLSGIVTLLEGGCQFAARSVNAVLTTTYWLVGQRLVEHSIRQFRRSFRCLGLTMFGHPNTGEQP